MGLASDFNKEVHKHITVHAAWLPVTNTFAVGDFGVISDGVFVKMGNVATDFGVQFQTQAGQQSSLDFKSDSVRLFRFAAGASVNAFPDNPIEAKLKIEFGKEKSFFVKAMLTVTAMESVFDVARRLAVIPQWNEGKFKVVSAAFTGQNCVVLSSTGKNAVIEIDGKADALKKLELGNLDAGLSFTSKSNLGLEILGQTGVVALRLFQVKKKEGLPDFLATRRMPGPDDITVIESQDMPAELPDDL